MSRLQEPVHLTWKQLAWFGGLVVLPWAMTISVALAIATHVNSEQQKTLDERAQAVIDLGEVKTDVGWLKRSMRRIEESLYGNSVIPKEGEDEEEEQ